MNRIYIWLNLCHECHSRKRDVTDGWCPACLTRRDRHIELYISAVLALPHNRTEKEVHDLTHAAIVELRALPPAGVVLALQDVTWQVVRRRE